METNAVVKEFILPLRVYIEDTDAGGIVYYVNYLKFMERSRTEFLRSLGYDKAAVLDDGLLLVVRSADVEYLQPAKMDDQIVATATLQKVANTYVVFNQQVRRGDIVLSKAIVKVACVCEAEGKMKPAAIPKSMRSSLLEML